MAEQESSREMDVLLKKRARRRLVGASALVLLAVIVLPMVMDHEPRPLVQDIQVRIPSQDAQGFAAKGAPGKVAATPSPVVEPKPEPKPESKPVPEANAEVVKSAPLVVALPKAENKPEPKPPVASSVALAKEAESKSATKTPPVAESAGQWEIQLGAYKEAGNAKILLTKLKELRIPAYSEKYDSPQGPRVRVRAGPFASREAAEKAHGRLRIIGVDGPVAAK